MANANGVITAIPPPDGYEVNFANPQRRLLTEAYVIFTIENILALMFLGQRLYTKIRLMKQFQIDDGTVFSNFRLENLLTEVSLSNSRLGLLSRYTGSFDHWFLHRQYGRARLGDSDREVRLLLAGKLISLLSLLSFVALVLMRRLHSSF